MRIKQVIAREIYDSRGFPTVECEIRLENDCIVTGSAPTGVSKSRYEAVPLYDDSSRLWGRGVTTACENIEQKISRLLIGRVPEVVQMDADMIELDGTRDKSFLGANAMIATSIAICKAQAVVEQIKLYELIAYLCQYDSVALPFPMFNIINGGKHANNNLQIQEFMVMPLGMSCFRESMEFSLVIYHKLKELLAKHGKSTAVGDEGGFASNFAHEQEALDYIMEAINYAQNSHGGSAMIALDVAASQFYDDQMQLYRWYSKDIDSTELIAWYQDLIGRYPIYSIEDGLSERDIDGWKKMYRGLHDKVQLVGDDVFATNPERIASGIKQQLATTAIIKPNQIGTVTETLQAIALCKEYGMKTIISHRSGETNDTFIADLAVGTSAGQIKAGGCSRGERMAKYNRLLSIEDSLMLAH